MATQREIVLSLKTTFDGAGIDKASRNLDQIAIASAQVDKALGGMDSAALRASKTAADLALAQQRGADAGVNLARAQDTLAAAYQRTLDPTTRGTAATVDYGRALRDVSSTIATAQRDLSNLARLKEQDATASERQAVAADKAAAASRRAADASFGSQLKSFNATAIGRLESGVARTAERGGLSRVADSLAQNYAYSSAPGAGLAFGLPAPVIAGVAIAGAGIYAAQQASTLDQQIRQLLGGTTGDASQIAPYTQGLLNISRSPGLGVNASTLTSDLYPILSSYSNAATPDALSAVKYGAQSAIGVNADPATFITGVIKEMQAFGASLSQFNQFADLNVSAIRAGSADPTGIASGVGTFANTAASAGVSARDAQAAFSQSTLTSRDAQESAFQENSFLQTFSRPATATQQRVAADLHLSLGPNALRDATLPGYIGQFQAGTAGLTDAERQRVGYALTGNQAAAGFLNSTTGARYGSYEATQATFVKSAGAGTSAFNLVAGGADQQGAAALARLNADVVQVGDNLLPLKGAAAGASLAMLGLAETGIPKFTTAIQDFAVQANSGMDGFVAYVKGLKNPGQVPSDIVHGLGTAAAAAGGGIGGVLSTVGGAIDSAASAGAGGVADTLSRAKAIAAGTLRNANSADYGSAPPPPTPPSRVAAAGSFGPGGDYYAPPNIASIFHFGRGYVAPATLPPDPTQPALTQRDRPDGSSGIGQIYGNAGHYSRALGAGYVQGVDGLLSGIIGIASKAANYGSGQAALHDANSSGAILNVSNARAGFNTALALGDTRSAGKAEAALENAINASVGSTEAKQLEIAKSRALLAALDAEVAARNLTVQQIRNSAQSTTATTSLTAATRRNDLPGELAALDQQRKAALTANALAEQQQEVQNRATYANRPGDLQRANAAAQAGLRAQDAATNQTYGYAGKDATAASSLQDIAIAQTRAGTGLAIASYYGRTADELKAINQQRDLALAAAKITDTKADPSGKTFAADRASINATYGIQGFDVLSQNRLARAGAQSSQGQADYTAAQRSGNVAGEIAGINRDRAGQLAAAALNDRGKDPSVYTADARGINQGANTRIQDALAQASQLQVQAAQTQLQAAQLQSTNFSGQRDAIQGLYHAQVAADRGITSPASRALADAQTLVTRNAALRGVDLAQANRQLGQDTTQISVDKAKGIPTSADVNKLIADATRFKGLTGATALDIENLRLQNTPYAIPRLAPSFVPGRLDPGIDAQRGSAVFRTGVYSKDSSAQQIALLTQQLNYAQQQLLETRQSLAAERQQVTELRGLRADVKNGNNRGAPASGARRGGR